MAWRLYKGLVISEKEKDIYITGWLRFVLLTLKSRSHISTCSSWPLMALEESEDYFCSHQEIFNTWDPLCC